MSPLVELAEFVTQAIAAQSFSVPLLVTREYTPRIEKKDFETLSDVRLFVVPPTQTAERMTRADWQRDIALQVGIFAAPEDRNDIAEVDALMDFADEVFQFVRELKPPDFSVPDAEHSVVYDWERLRTEGIFASLISVSFTTTK